jgi:SAM-dependent methyltransferase
MHKADESPVHISAGKPAEPDHLIILRRYRLVKSLASFDGRILLDFGCGNGSQTLLFADDFPIVIGLDIDSGNLRRLRLDSGERESYGRIVPVQYDGEQIPLPGGSVDGAVSFEVLEHVRNERQALAELWRVIRPEGLLAISVPNRWWVFETHGADLPVLPWNRVPFFSWLPKRLHDRYARARIYTRREIERKLRRAGFSIERSVYVTAPMDVLKNRSLQRLLRRTIFRNDSTRIPCIATALLVIARRVKI